MPVVSSHFDHLTGRCVMGQQVLTLELATEAQFVRGVNEDKEQAGKHDWALFLGTGSLMDDETMLEVYALRWGDRGVF
jgi:hypothetical protein